MSEGMINIKEKIIQALKSRREPIKQPYLPFRQPDLPFGSLDTQSKTPQSENTDEKPSTTGQKRELTPAEIADGAIGVTEDGRVIYQPDDPWKSIGH